jgi:hypothetical protein
MADTADDQPFTFDWLQRAWRELPLTPPPTQLAAILTRTGEHADHTYENDHAGTGTVRCSCGLFAPGRVNVDG